jgi:predicted CXXCH cytochrome family protein
MWYILISALISAFVSPRPPQIILATGAQYDHSGTSSPMGAGADSCRACHEGGSYEFNTTADLNCYGCHHDTQAKAQKAFKHVEVTSQAYQALSCEGCHKLHRASGRPLLKTEELELCQSCHPDQGGEGTHPVMGLAGGRLITGSDGKPLTCASHCHDVHGADFRYLSRKEPGRELCISCHKDF